MARKQRHDIAGLGLAALLAWGCGSSTSGTATAPILSDDGDDESGRPNVVLIVTDALPQTDTGHVRDLADSGIRFPGGPALPAPAGSAPWQPTAIRSSLLTGLHPEILGFGHSTDELSAIPPAGVKAFPELLREAGYFTVRSGVARRRRGWRRFTGGSTQAPSECNSGRCVSGAGGSATETARS